MLISPCELATPCCACLFLGISIFCLSHTPPLHGFFAVSLQASSKHSIPFHSLPFPSATSNHLDPPSFTPHPHSPRTNHSSPFNLRTLHRQKVTQPLKRLLRLRGSQMLHGLEQMRRNMLIQVESRWTAVRYGLRGRLLRWMRRVAR